MGWGRGATQHGLGHLGRIVVRRGTAWRRDRARPYRKNARNAFEFTARRRPSAPSLDGCRKTSGKSRPAEMTPRRFRSVPGHRNRSRTPGRRPGCCSCGCHCCGSTGDGRVPAPRGWMKALSDCVTVRTRAAGAVSRVVVVARWGAGRRASVLNVPRNAIRSPRSRAVNLRSRGRSDDSVGRATIPLSMAHDLLQGLQRAVMHVRRRAADLAQARRLERMLCRLRRRTAPRPRSSPDRPMSWKA